MTQVSDIVERLRHPNAYLDGETYIVTSVDREDPRQEEQQTATASAFMDWSMEAGPPRSHSGHCYLTAARVRSTLIS